jgi:Xaa-Pro aminopeptidase
MPSHAAHKFTFKSEKVEITMSDQIEGLGEKFELQKYLEAREICKGVTWQVAQLIQPKMTEIQAQELIKSEFKKAGFTKFWHVSKFRIGRDTLKNFGEASDSNLVIEPGDVFFIDIGPVWNDHEADFGETFFVKSDSISPVDARKQTGKDIESLERIERLHKMIQTSKEVWQETAKAWRDQNLTGEKLYNFAAEITEAKGFKFNREMAGHRLGDFPHSLFSKLDLAEFKLTPKENIWVLEIHILCPELERGAFFEDILI